MNDYEIFDSKSVTIVGGGTAGWITALALSTYCPLINLTLIQPKVNKAIGVGESTQPDFLGLVSDAGINIAEIMEACDGTFKCGIYYEDWNEIGENYWHPFSSMANDSTYTIAHHYQQLKARFPEKYSHKDYYKSVHPSYSVCVEDNKVDPVAARALHIDADKLHTFLRTKLPKVNVIEIDDVEVFADEDKISHLMLDGDTKYESGLFVDCTGFNQLLIKQIKNEETYYYHDNVSCAIFARIPYLDKEKEMVSYTKAHAQKHGWIWTIPLASRIGSGYVYAPASCPPDEAEKNFREYWGVERMKDMELRHIKFPSTSLRTPWQKNVVAIGLSSGFVEPLEATGISWLVNSATMLSKLIAVGYYDQEQINIYNSSITNYVQDVQDFVDVHYKLSKRKDSIMWNYHTTRPHHPRLDKRLEVYGDVMPSAWNRPKTTLWAFNEVSWIDILNGYDFKFEKLEIAKEYWDAAEKEMKRIKSIQKGRSEKCKSQVEILKEFYDTPNI